VFTDLIVITGIYPPDPGGPAKFASEFSSWCSEKIAKVKVISYFDQATKEGPDSPLAFVGVSRADSILQRYFRMIQIIGRATKHFSHFLSVGAFLETYIASIIYKFNYVAKVPGDIVWERARNNGITNLDIESFQHSSLPIKYKIFRIFFTRSLLRASKVVVPSQGLFQMCRQWGIPESKLILVRNSVDLEKFSGLSHDLNEFDILTICRLTPWKGVDELIQYCAEHKLRLAVAGDGPERRSLEKLSASLDADVAFFGDVSENTIIELLQKSRIFVLNSYYEGLPHALVEARAAGLITVARDGTGSAEVINDDVDGFLIRDGRSLSETINLALSEPLSASEIGLKAAFDASSRFDKEVNFNTILVTLFGVNE
jgi:glycosyltransferase involved in cell wall biosynthesis